MAVFHPSNKSQASHHMPVKSTEFEQKVRYLRFKTVYALHTSTHFAEQSTAAIQPAPVATAIEPTGAFGSRGRSSRPQVTGRPGPHCTARVKNCTLLQRCCNYDESLLRSASVGLWFKFTPARLRLRLRPFSAVAIQTLYRLLRLAALNFNLAFGSRVEHICATPYSLAKN
ncbi:hypothetical protein SKAU_G00050750 [Synaphobranchus kaupii]|uniref:Uncharacterized protein n=1 Tax=Synaphobranchus kaupii TaxID=118154 RepID=A0A9Q1G4C9_SYNKA|nr:hypothetical protein SKAU_G00050750 [Synaphobranchus kaupii]